MESYLRVILPAAGVLVLIFTWRRWLTEWVVPTTLGKWLLASLWAVFPVVLFFLGFAIEQGKMFSIRGIGVILIVLIVVWGVTGLPMLFFGALNAVKSRKVRDEYARMHGLRYSNHLIIKNLMPKSISGYIGDLLTNVLYVGRNAYIAGALRHKGKQSGGLRGSEVVLVEGVSARGPVVATQRKFRAKDDANKEMNPGSLQSLLNKSMIRVENVEFRVIVAERIREIGSSLMEGGEELPAAQEMVRSILSLIAKQGPDLLEESSTLCIFNGRIVLELKGFLNDRNKLGKWVACAKQMAGWLPPHEVRPISS